MTSLVNTLLSVLVFLCDIFIVLYCIGLIAKTKTALDIKEWISEHSLLLGFLVALAATLGSLFYSEIANYTPCKLCWFQRIFIYPQVILLGLALWKKDQRIRLYSLALSSIGALIALDHYILQTTGISLVPCSTVGYSASCSQRFVLEYGYITIPMMSLTAFCLLLVIFLPKIRQYAINKAL